VATDIELYEVLKPKLGEEGARLIAERLGDQAVATKADIQELRTDFAEFKAEMRDWMLRYFIPLWIGVYGTLGALIVSIVLKS
jgi:hypothetical protein